ncbi:eukaryotic translation initiation factor 4G-like isoform X2 [Diospyros lotus]|uniref:eukaryotic translation initiation factor 4G-like isoform X2 n=1 Tax=Diospyros lotus TaxID=55363 RepID=UPI0022536EC1|nr:eukaryotic translation initiation factor 4G-like isoform X2 [Diospyros lotus]
MVPICNQQYVAHHDSLRVVPQFPIPPVPKQQIPRNDGGAGKQTNAGHAHQMSKAKRDAQVSSVSPVAHTQKASIHPVRGISMPMPFHQPQIPVQFGPNPLIQSQGMAATSLPIPVPMPLTMGNASQLQQPMFVSSLPPHPMQPQGIMHQGQSLNFTSQMGPQLPPQLGNLGVSIGSQFTQQQAGKFAPRKPFKIAHPDTHEELRLDKRSDTHVDGGSSGSRSQPNVPQSQPFTSVPPAEALTVSNVNASRESYPSPGKNIDRQSGARSDRRGSGICDDDKWSKLPGPLASGRDPRMDSYGGNLRPGQGGNYGVLRNPRAQAPAQYSGGILSGPLHSQGPQGSSQRNNSDSGRWQRATAFQKGLMPFPQTPLQVMHKAEKKYQVGKVADEEKAKQRQLKAILKKLTPLNFDKLFEQVKAVNINNAVTLTGVVTQIFDKALMEPTFCEMYANFCYHLAGELPDFSEDNEKITFKRLLLNKCQEEFERGEREQQEADRADIGEVKQSEEEREEKRIKARRRMLGNIRFIGELYKKKMLTERIMHECIKKLLGQYQNPDEEDIEVEALCILMSTVGEMIDHPKAKEHMDAYFDMMAKLSNNMKLSSSIRSMLKDAIDLRKNKWQQRRKIEGPKKIEEVHRDAAQERQVQAGRLTRGPSMNASVRNRQTMDFGARGSHMVSSASAQMGSFRGLPTQHRGHGIQDVRMDNRYSFDNRTLSVPLPHRPNGEDTITLGPQGGLAGGMSIGGQPSIPNNPLPEVSSPGDSRRVATGLNGYSSVQDRTVFGSREDLMPRYPSDRFGAPSDLLSVQDRCMNYGNKDIRNADRCVERSLPTSPTLRGRAPLVSQNVSSDKVWPEE